MGTSISYRETGLGEERSWTGPGDRRNADLKTGRHFQETRGEWDGAYGKAEKEERERGNQRTSQKPVWVWDPKLGEGTSQESL